MKQFLDKIQKFEFEARIFVSFAIVGLAAFLSFFIFQEYPVLAVIMGKFIGFSAELSRTVGFLTIAFMLIIASILRMWAGSILTPVRMMRFQVQTDGLIEAGPYRLVRHPIYLADLIAFSAFALCLPLIGILLPVLLFLHYGQLICYEEKSLLSQFLEEYTIYRGSTPRIIPTPRSFKNIPLALREFCLNWDGVRHNSLYLLFIPGFIVAAFTGNLFYAMLIGVPGVIDWAIVHTKIGIDRQNEDNRGNRSEIRGAEKGGQKFYKKVTGDILYAQCWEDSQMDRVAFRINPSDVVFSITSGGCNLLTLLLDNPCKVIALDMNPCQNYLLNLKMKAMERLEYGEFLELMGVRDSRRRQQLYQQIRPFLNESSRGYWDQQMGKIKKGLIHCGRYERYMTLLRRVVTLLVGKKLINRFFQTLDPLSRKALFETNWKNLRWKILTRILLSRRLMSYLFDKAFFDQLEEDFSFGDHFASKAEYALTQLPLAENYFLSYILLGRFYNESCLPPYMLRENYEIVRQRLNRIEVVTDNCEHYFSTLADNSISKFNFTNIFEWMPSTAFENLLRETIRVAKNGAVITYRNLLVCRERPAAVKGEIQPLTTLSKRLLQQDLSFIYNNYVVEKINKRKNSCLTSSNQYGTAAC